MCRDQKTSAWTTFSDRLILVVMVTFQPLSNLDLLSFEDVRRSVYYILKGDPSVDPESLEDLAVNHARSVWMIEWIHL